MKATRIVRRVDDLGRIVIPKEVRRSLRIKENDPLELYVENDYVIFKKYDVSGSIKRILDDTEAYIKSEAYLSSDVTDALLKKVSEMKEILAQEGTDNEND